MTSTNPTGTSHDRTNAIVWSGLVLATILTVVVTSVADLLIFFGRSSTCGDAPATSEVHDGQLSLLVVLGVAATAWLLGFLLASSRRTPILTCGLVAVLPAVLFLLDGLSTDAWVGSICF